jgi:hypothetical protein
MKAHLITILVLNDERLSNKDIAYYIETRKFLHSNVVCHKVADVQAYDDNHPLNQYDTMKEELERMQKENLFVGAD